MFLDRNSVPFAGANNYHIHTSEFRTGEFYPNTGTHSTNSSSSSAANSNTV